MTITFQSTITQPGNEPQKITFKAPVEISHEDGFKVLQFLEPNTKIANRIEISPGTINIFSGAASLNLELNTDLEIEYTTESGAFYLTSRLDKVEIAEQKISFEYTLKQKSTLIGAYKINLLID